MFQGVQVSRSGAGAGQAGAPRIAAPHMNVEVETKGSVSTHGKQTAYYLFTLHFWRLNKQSQILAGSQEAVKLISPSWCSPCPPLLPQLCHQLSSQPHPFTSDFQIFQQFFKHARLSHSSVPLHKLSPLLKHLLGLPNFYLSSRFGSKSLFL